MGNPNTDDSKNDVEENQEAASSEAASTSSETESKTDTTEHSATSSETKKETETTLSYPAKDKTFTASAGKYNIDVTVPAKSFKDEVSLKASKQAWDDLTDNVQKQLTDQGVDKENSQSLDLRFEDADGKEIEPANKVSVKFTIKDKDILKDASSDDGQVTVFHAEEKRNDTGKIESIDVKPVASTQDKSIVVHSETKATVEFETYSFSTYTISGFKHIDHDIDLTYNHQNAEVKIVWWNYSNRTASNIQSQILSSDSASDHIQTSNGNAPDYTAYFIKPKEGYVITGVTQNVESYGNNKFDGIIDFYDIDDNIGWNKGGFNTYIKGGNKADYDFYHGYTTFDNGLQGSVTISTAPVSLGITATASTGNAALKAGDTTTFTITLQPHVEGADNVNVDSVESFNVTINGRNYDVDLSRQADGTYRGIITDYVVTAEDVRNGSVELSASATLKYTSTYKTTGQDQQTSEHHSSGMASASTSVSCPISPNMNLEISKTVNGTDTAKEIAGTSNKSFDFNITASKNDSALSGTYQMYKDDSTTAENIIFTNGSAQISLKNGGSVIIHLPNGTKYSVSEDPMNDPYAFDHVDVTGDGSVTDSTTVSGTLLHNTTAAYTNRIKIGSVSFIKKGAQITGDPVPLSGATFGLYKDQACEGTAVATATSEETSGNVSFRGIPVGTYYMKETAAPENYVADDTVYTVTVSEKSSTISNGTTPITEITNALASRNVMIKKTAEDGNTPLAGARFTLKNGNSAVTINDKAYNNFTVSKDGEAINGLPIGTYTLEETKAPDGYIITDTSTTITVDKDGVKVGNQAIVPDKNGTYTIVIKNRAGQALPNTGSTGTLPYTLGGLAIIAMAALMYGFVLRRNNRERRFK